MRWTHNKFTKALGILAILALVMISIDFGAISPCVNGGDPALLPALRLAFAIVFAAGSVFFEARGADWNCIAVSSVSYLRGLI